MSNSLVKFRNRTVSGDKKMFWGRADQDGAPFRGTHPPIMTEDEYEARMVKVKDPKNGFFDVTDPAQNKEYLAVMDAIVNGWFQCIFIERFWNKTNKHYIEWVEFYCEDGTPTPHLKTGGNMEVNDGQGHGPFNPGPTAG